MIVLGLTGGIGMGKSTVAVMLRAMGCAVHDADAVVHRLLSKDGDGVAPVASRFPATLVNGAIDRQRLGAAVFAEPEARRALEAIVHPLVRAAERDKRARAQAAGRRVLVLDIPLLFETGAEARCDIVLCVTASAAVQRRRVLARSGMTVSKFEAIRAAQLPDAEKRRRATYVVRTDCGYCLTWWQLRWILSRLQASRAHQACARPSMN